MSAFILPASGGLSNKDNVWTLAVALGVLYSTYSLLARIYSVYFGPLSKIPGPKLRAFTRIPDVIATVRGTKDRELVKLHGKYGVAVRIRPREVSYAASPEVWKEISGFKSVTYAQTHTHSLTHPPFSHTHTYLSAHLLQPGWHLVLSFNYGLTLFSSSQRQRSFLLLRSKRQSRAQCI